MKRFIKTNALNIIAIMISVFMGVLPYWILTQEKSLSIKLVAQVPLGDSITGVIKGLALTFDGKPLNSALFTIISIENDGKIPILKTDFEMPLELRVTSGSKIQAAKVLRTMPLEQQVTVASEDKTILFSPSLLNPGDSLELGILTSNGLPGFSIRGRVAGISKLAIQKEGGSKRGVIFLSVIVIALAYVASISYAIIAYRFCIIDRFSRDKDIMISLSIWGARFTTYVLLFTMSILWSGFLILIGKYSILLGFAYLVLLIPAAPVAYLLRIRDRKGEGKRNERDH